MATTQSTFCDSHGINKRATTIGTIGVSGGSIKSLLQIELECIAEGENGKAAGPVLLGNTALLESSDYNLFSLSKLLNSRWKMHGNASKVVMTNGSKVSTLDIDIKTTKGVISCALFKCGGAAVAGANAELAKLISIDNVHRLLWHSNEELPMASRLGWCENITLCLISYLQDALYFLPYSFWNFYKFYLIKL